MGANIGQRGLRLAQAPVTCPIYTIISKQPQRVRGWDQYSRREGEWNSQKLVGFGYSNTNEDPIVEMDFWTQGWSLCCLRVAADRIQGNVDVRVLYRERLYRCGKRRQRPHGQ